MMKKLSVICISILMTSLVVGYSPPKEPVVFVSAEEVADFMHWHSSQ